MSKQTKSMFGTIYDALPEDPGEEQRCNVKVSQSVQSQYCRAIKEEKKSVQKEIIAKKRKKKPQFCRAIKEEKKSTQKERIAKNRSKKSKPTMAQEIEAMKLIGQCYQTFDVCELADMGVI